MLHSKRWRTRLGIGVLALVLLGVGAGIVHAAYYGFSGGIPFSFNAYRANSSPVATLTVTGAQYQASYNPTGSGPFIHPLCDAAATNAGLPVGTQEYYCIIKMQVTPAPSGGGCPPVFGAGCGSGPGVTIGLGGPEVIGDVRAQIFTVAPTTYLYPPTTVATGANDCNPAIPTGSSYSHYCATATAPARPDITAGAPAPSSGTVGQPITFSATVYNGGGASTGNSFSNFFIVRNAANGGGSDVFYNFPTAGPIGAGGNQSISSTATWTPSSPGTYSVILCADEQGSWNGGTIAETNEGNNCGAWTNITVADPIPNPPTNLQASCNAAGVATLSWTASPGASGYYVRVTPTNGGTCPTNWQVAPWNSTYCIPNPDNVSGTSVAFGSLLGQNYSWWVHGRLAGGAWGPESNGSFTCTGSPNLTASTGGNQSGSTGTSLTLGGTVSNTGNTSTGVSFPNIVQVCNDAGCSTYNQRYQISPNMNALAAGASQATSRSVTLPGTSGSYVYRLCADNTTGWVGSVTESNEGDNCGGWSTLTVSAPTPTADLNGPASVPSGTGPTLTWTCTNSTSASITGVGPVTPTAGGSVNAPAITTTTNYQLSCTGSSTATDAITVNVTNPTVTITATPDRVNGSGAGGSSTVVWTGSQVDACTITRNGTAFATGVSGSQSATGITGQTTFVATCDAGGVPAVATSQVIVNVIPEFEEF